jgi:hypothetical protein
MPLGPFPPPLLPPPCCRESISRKIRENRRRWIRDVLVPCVYGDVPIQDQCRIASALIAFTDLADFPWPYQTGPFGYCAEWADKFQEHY